MAELYDASKKLVKDSSTETKNTDKVERVANLAEESQQTVGTVEAVDGKNGEKSPSTMALKLQARQTVRDFLPRKTGNSLSSLIVLPSSKVRFETQDTEEEVLVILRAHWLTNVPWLVIATLLMLAPKVLAFFPLLDAFPDRFKTAFVISWYLVALMYVFEQFLGWFFNLAIITDERIIDVNFSGLTGRKIADAELDKIQDVTFVNSGVAGTIFNYGDVLVQTAAEVVQFVFNDVPQPSKVAEILQKLRIEEKQEALEGRIR